MNAASMQIPYQTYVSKHTKRLRVLYLIWTEPRPPGRAPATTGTRGPEPAPASLVWTNSRPPGTAPATTGTTGPGPAPATPHTGLHVFPYLACETSHLAKQSSQPGSPTGPAGTACPSLPPSARPAPASIFDFRPLFQATDAVPCCCKRTTKSSVLSCRAASATATQMFAAIGLAPMVADPPASTGFAAS